MPVIQSIISNILTALYQPLVIIIQELAQELFI